MFKVTEKTFGELRKLTIGPLEYAGLVKQLNHYAQREISIALREYSSRLGAVTLMTPGSDGRQEKGSLMSKLEIIALVPGDEPPRHFERIVRGVFRRIFNNNCDISVVEVKTNKTPLMRFNANGRVQPSRAQDAAVLHGDQRGHRARLGKEIVAASSDEVNKVADLRRDARLATERGVNRIGGSDAVHFDLEGGVVFYNPKGNQQSFKIGPLRLVQSTLMLEAVRHVRRSGDANFFESLEPNIVDRLRQLSDDRKLSVERASALEAAEHYAYFLRLYHRSEEAYARRGTVALQLSPAEVASIKARLAALSAIMNKIKIG